MDKFDAFKKKEKFFADTAILYPGIADPAMRPILTEKINQAADDFKEAFSKRNPTENDYREAIASGLDRFRNIYVDTEDKERIGHYFEELMAIVGLKSSGGLLNTFLYGFDPDEFKK